MILFFASSVSSPPPPSVPLASPSKTVPSTTSAAPRNHRVQSCSENTTRPATAYVFTNQHCLPTVPIKLLARLSPIATDAFLDFDRVAVKQYHIATFERTIPPTHAGRTKSPGTN